MSVEGPNGHEERSSAFAPSLPSHPSRASRDLPALAPDELRQLNGVLRELAPAVARGWARLVPVGGGALGAFAVILDGAEPGLGTDDGAFVPGVPE